MQEDPIPEALTEHWNASAAGDAEAEHDIYADDAICDYPQSGERIPFDAPDWRRQWVTGIAPTDGAVPPRQ